MSKGLGFIQRELVNIFDAKPDEAFRVDELCWLIYGSRGHAPAKSRRVAVIRAGKSLVSLRPALDWFANSGPGHSLTFYNHESVMSYARAWMKSEGYHDIEARLAPGGYEHKDIIEGGRWWLAVRVWVAERDADSARLAELQPMVDARNEAREAALAMCRASLLGASN